MEHHQPTMLDFCIMDDYLELESHPTAKNPAIVAMEDQKTSENFIGFLEVIIHQARDIHNVCIYQSQDVYAKICLTDNLEKEISSQTIEKGGQNPVFNETLRLGVRTMESRVRCEVCMLSRIRNYLEDQLLGFVLVPLCDAVSESGKAAREFELSSSELFHSPAGFVELSFKYNGASQEAVVGHPVNGRPDSLEVGVAEQHAGVSEGIPCELERIEFPDQEIVRENERMVLEYLKFPCDQLEPQCAVDSPSLGNDDNLNVETAVHSVEKADLGQEDQAVPEGPIGQPPLDVTVKSELKVEQEEIVEMYMRGMQQFTDALAKMKLPVDIADGSSTDKDKSKVEGSGPDEKAEGSKSADPSQRVFYGSRAFF